MKLAKVSLVLSCLAMMTGCPSSSTNSVACNDMTLCPEGQACVDNLCVDYVDCLELAKTDKACGVGFRCEEQITGAACVTESGCRVSKDCTGAGEVCIAGVCGAAPAASTVASCEIVNDQRSFATNAVVPVKAVAYDASKRLVPYQAFTLTADGGFTASGTSITAAGTTAANSTVTAKFGSVECTAVFRNIGTISGTNVARLTLYKTAGGTAVGSEKISGFTTANFIAADANGSALANTSFSDADAANGVYTVSFPDSAVAITIAHPDYNVTTVLVGPVVTGGRAAGSNLDLVLPLEPFHSGNFGDTAANKGDTSGFTGKPNFAPYDAAYKRQQNGKQISAAYAGGSLPLTTLLNFNFALFAGDTAAISPTSLTTLVSGGADCGAPKAATSTATDTVPLPRAMWLGNTAGNGQGPNCAGYAARVVPGRRIGWSLGLKLDTGIITELFGLVSNPAIDNILKSVLPLADTIAMGVDPLTSATAGQPNFHSRVPSNEWEAFVTTTQATGAGNDKFKTANVAPANRLFNVVNFDNPGFTKDFYRGATDDQKLTGMVALVAAVSPVYGIVPVGFGAGVDVDNNLKLDKLSATDPRFIEDKVHVRHSYLPSDIADADVMGLLIATNLTDLAAKAEVKKSKAVRVKGLVARNQTDKIAWAKNSAVFPTFTEGKTGFAASVAGFSTIANPKYSLNTNLKQIILPGLRQEGDVAADAVIVRVDRSDDKTERFWNIIILPSAIVADNDIRLSYQGAENIVESPAGALTDMAFAAIGLRFGSTDRSSILTRLAPSYGKDLETIAGEVTSFSLYYETATKL